MKRQFYIFGHNPNTIESAAGFLKNGANALEPDICYHPDAPEKFFVYDSDNPFDRPPLVNIQKRVLTDYLADLVSTLKANPTFNLAMIAFDLKPPFHNEDATLAYDVKELYSVIRANFSVHFPKVAILTTVGHVDGMDFLRIAELNANEGIGIDDGTTPAEANDYFKPLHMPYTYASGTSSPVGSTTSKMHLQKISDAVMMRDKGGSFSLVYVWTVTSEHAMQTYLDHDVDGILTNVEDVPALVTLIKTNYATQFELATQDHNPFGVLPVA
ncbi:MAG: hypothetical protein ACXVPQ_08200 [Bacteroidia bacterium]